MKNKVLVWALTEEALWVNGSGFRYGPSEMNSEVYWIDPDLLTDGDAVWANVEWDFDYIPEEDDDCDHLLSISFYRLEHEDEYKDFDFPMEERLIASHEIWESQLYALRHG